MLSVPFVFNLIFKNMCFIVDILLVMDSNELFYWNTIHLAIKKQTVCFFYENIQPE